jgi:MATE family multidrug resistance protein
LISYIRQRWQDEGGYRNVLSVAFPLILSTASWSVQHFIDRVFLTWYSQETVAAAMPAGILNFAILSLFMGTAGYVNTFVAQYHGAKRNRRIGPVIWQGLYVAAIGGAFLLLLYPFADPIFRLIGHHESIRIHESVYFKTLCLGGFPVIAESCGSIFSPP